MLKIITTIGCIQVLAILITVVRSKIMAILLGPEGIGVTSVIDQVVQFVGYLSVFSLPLASLKFLSKSHSEGFEVFKKSYSSFFMLVLILAVTATTIAIGLVIANLLGSDILKYKAVLIIALFAVPANVLGGFFSHVLAAAQKTTHSAMLSVVTVAALAISTYIGISLGGIQGLYLSNVSAIIVVTIAILIYFKIALNLPLYDKSVKIFDAFKSNRDIIPFSFMLYLATTTHSLSFLVARYFVLKYYGEAETGILQAAISIAMSIGMVLGPTNGLFLSPIMNRNIPKHEKITTAIEFQKKLILILNIVAMAIALFPYLLLNVLYSPLFAVAGQYIFLFVISQYILQLAGVYQVLIVGFDDLKMYAFATCSGNLATILFSWLLIPHYGILGVGISFIVSGFIIFVITHTNLGLRHGLSIPRVVYSLVGYSLLSIVFIGMLFNKQNDINVMIILEKIGIYLFFMFSLLFFLNKEERNFLYSLLMRAKFATRK